MGKQVAAPDVRCHAGGDDDWRGTASYVCGADSLAERLLACLGCISLALFGNALANASVVFRLLSIDLLPKGVVLGHFGGSQAAIAGDS